MAKRTKKQANKGQASAASESPALTAPNPFAALSGLRDALPEGDANLASQARDTEASGAPASVRQGSSLSLDPSAASSQAVSKVVLQREKKGRGGKTVTRVRGLPSGELSAYATKLKKALGCGASVEDADVLLHGELVDRGAQWFEAQGVRRVVRGN